MNRQEAQQLLARLILGELDEPTKRDLLAYLQTDPDLRRELAAMRRTVDLLQGAAEAEPPMALTAKRRVRVLGRRGAMRSSGNPRPQWWPRQISLAPHYALAAGILLMAGLLVYALLMPSLGRAREATDAVAIREGQPTDAAFEDDLAAGEAVQHRDAEAREFRARVKADPRNAADESEPAAAPPPMRTPSPVAEPMESAPNATYRGGGPGKSGSVGTEQFLKILPHERGGGGGGPDPRAAITTDRGVDGYSSGGKVNADLSGGATVVIGGSFKADQTHRGQAPGQSQHRPTTPETTVAAAKARKPETIELSLNAPADRPGLNGRIFTERAEAEKKLPLQAGGEVASLESRSEAPAQFVDSVSSGMIAKAGASDTDDALKRVEGGRTTSRDRAHPTARPSVSRPAKLTKETEERLAEALEGKSESLASRSDRESDIFLAQTPGAATVSDRKSAKQRVGLDGTSLDQQAATSGRASGEETATYGVTPQVGGGSVSGLPGKAGIANELKMAESRRRDRLAGEYAYKPKSAAPDVDGDGPGDTDWGMRGAAKDAASTSLGVDRSGSMRANTIGQRLGDPSIMNNPGGDRPGGLATDGGEAGGRFKQDAPDSLALPQSQAEALPAGSATVRDPLAATVMAEKQATDSPGGPVSFTDLTSAPALDDAEAAQSRAATAAGDKTHGIHDLHTGQPVAPPDLQQAPQAEPEDEEASLPPASQFAIYPVNPWESTEQDHQSTFGLDVDTASYTLARRYLKAGYRPPHGAIRMEEFVNAFDYNYPQQQRGVFSVHAEGAPNPFARPGNPTTLLKIGIRGKVIGRDARRPVHLVFVVDTSGSMARADRLPLVQYTLTLLVSELEPTDKVSLVTYGNEARLILEAVPVGKFRPRIVQVIQAMRAGGSTNMIQGMQLGYALARRAFVAGQTSRVILCSDGVANIGETDAEAILKKVEHNRDQGITFTAAGFGFGAYNDQLLEQLANRGDGNYVFIDSQAEAREQFVDRMSAMLQTIAKDAKIQVEFNPRRVRRYRLIGYENRAIADEQFRDDTVDAGEVGSGQSATAMYELELVGEPGPEAYRDLGTVYVRYRNVETGAVEEINRRLESSMVRRRAVADAPRFYLAACAAQTAELLRGSEHAVRGNFADVQRVLTQVCNVLPLDNRAAELLWMAQRAEQLPPAP